MTGVAAARRAKADLEQRQHQLADELAATRGSEAGQLATAATLKQGLQSSQEDFQASVRSAAADWLVFEPEAPPPPPGEPVRYSQQTLDWIFWMFGAANGRPTDETVH